ncbi:helix-turn-helix domain-containing protein [Tumebacillus permanentifrigoris]|uniref:Transcriptional regulator with XRE-family HTH domain n=1 Tax=Tumebacillus permanentifrigoris TaxID=378543 RepID=A0A316DT70_9BACL|nr:helix-turn-helix transcriptional regulator [Tumebacillus permanentifrigoris]PWK10209.1 transcriptional regulator with XRE-family HTH domain [Tumebacillus permanentifrigoris]
MNLCDKLRNERKKHKLTQQQVADLIGITESGYGFYEQGKRKPPYDHLQALAQHYGVTTDYLLGVSDVPHMTEAQSRSLRSIIQIREDLANDLILDVDDKPFTPDGKEEALQELDRLIKLRQLQK